MVRSLAWLALLCLALAAPAAVAQTQQCGDIQLVFRNPDLQPGTDGFIRAQGQFFIQFQAIGKDADKIAVFGFSFGPHTADFDGSACDAPAWVTGAYLPNYRADRDPTDGFFIPIKTTLVPDGTYAAAVHAYDASNNELARFWAKAVVDNCDPQPTPAQERCDGDGAQAAKHDKTAPWPIVLPGDGQPLEGKRLTVEFGEDLASFQVGLNGEDVTAQMAKWDGRLWDADLFPDYGPGGASAAVAEPCTQPHQTCERYGPAYEWTGRALSAADVIRVEATDLAGNRAVKDIHLGSTVQGGAVTQDLPILAYTVDATRRAVGPGQAAVFAFEVRNNGNGAGHPFAAAGVPEGWAAEWQPVHVAVGPGEAKRQELLVTPPPGAAPGVYAVNATLTYQSGGEEKALTAHLTVEVAQGGLDQASTMRAPEPANASPLSGWPAIVALLGLAFLLRRSR